MARCRQFKAEQRDTGNLDAIWARAVEHARKIALIIACGVEFGTPIISPSVAAYAIALVEHVVTQLIISVQDNVSSTEFGRDINRVLKAIRSGGADGVSATQLGRLTQGMTPRVRTEAINELLTTTKIRKGERKAAKGPAAVVYVAA